MYLSSQNKTCLIRIDAGIQSGFQCASHDCKDDLVWHIRKGDKPKLINEFRKIKSIIGIFLYLRDHSKHQSQSLKRPRFNTSQFFLQEIVKIQSSPRAFKNPILNKVFVTSSIETPLYRSRVISSIIIGQVLQVLREGLKSCSSQKYGLKNFNHHFLESHLIFNPFTLLTMKTCNIIFPSSDNSFRMVKISITISIQNPFFSIFWSQKFSSQFVISSSLFPKSNSSSSKNLGEKIIYSPEIQIMCISPPEF